MGIQDLTDTLNRHHNIKVCSSFYADYLIIKSSIRAATPKNTANKIIECSINNALDDKHIENAMRMNTFCWKTL